MKNKIKIYLDFDNTITDTSQRLLELLNKKYNKQYSKSNIYKYDLSDLYPETSSQDIYNICSDKYFYNELKPINGVIETLSSMNNNYKYYIASVCYGESHVLKQKYLDDICGNKISFSGFYIFDKNKSCLDMSDGIVIDDNSEMLRSTNSKFKILFKNNMDVEWNRVNNKDEFYIVNTWNEIEDILKFISIQK